MRVVLRLAGLGASVPVVVILVFGVGFLARIEGSGWCTYQRFLQWVTLLRIQRLSQDVLRFESEHGRFPKNLLSANTKHYVLLAREQNDHVLPNRPGDPFSDAWGQSLGYKNLGTRFLIWSTGFDGGNPGSEPKWIQPFDTQDIGGWMISRFRPGSRASLGDDTVVIGGTFAIRDYPDREDARTYVDRVLVVQYPDLALPAPREGPLNLGRLFGTAIFRMFGPT